MDDDDIEWELSKMDEAERRREAPPLRTVYRPVDPGLKARILRMFGQPYDKSAIPRGQEFYLNGWDNGEDDGEDGGPVVKLPDFTAQRGGKTRPAFGYDPWAGAWRPDWGPEGNPLRTMEERPRDGMPNMRTMEYRVGRDDVGAAVQPLSADASGDDQKFQVDGTLQSSFQGPNTPKTQLQDIFPANKNSTPEPEAKSPYGFVKPISSGTEAGYEGDSGLDIGASVSTPVLAAAGGRVVYAEAGHTSWQRRDPKTGEPIDTPYSVLIELDTPVTFKDGRQAKYIWYTHMSKLGVEKGEGDEQEIRVKPGQVIGYSGTANDSPHLHFGVLTNRAQKEGDYFTPAEVREILGIKEKQTW